MKHTHRVLSRYLLLVGLLIARCGNQEPTDPISTTDAGSNAMRKSAGHYLVEYSGSEAQLASAVQSVGDDVAAVFPAIKVAKVRALTAQSAAQLQTKQGIQYVTEDEMVEWVPPFNTAMQTVRVISHDLRPVELDLIGLTVALRALADSVTTTGGMHVEMSLDPIDGVFGDAGEILLYRICQEAFSNILRHAQSTHANFTVVRRNGTVQVTIAGNDRRQENACEREISQCSFHCSSWNCDRGTADEKTASAGK